MKRILLRNDSNSSFNSNLRKLSYQSPKAYNLLMSEKDRVGSFSRFSDLILERCLDEASRVIQNSLTPLRKMTLMTPWGDVVFTPRRWEVGYVGLRGSVLFGKLHVGPDDVKYKGREFAKVVIKFVIHELAMDYKNAFENNSYLCVPVHNLDKSLTDNSIYNAVKSHLGEFFK